MARECHVPKNIFPSVVNCDVLQEEYEEILFGTVLWSVQNDTVRTEPGMITGKPIKKRGKGKGNTTYS